MHLQTCYSRANRLKQAAVTNKHVAVKGMPKISKTEVEHIIKTILAMKGTTTKKHKGALAKG